MQKQTKIIDYYYQITCINKMSFPSCLTVNKIFQTSDHSNRFPLITIYEHLIKKS